MISNLHYLFTSTLIFNVFFSAIYFAYAILLAYVPMQFSRCSESSLQVSPSLAFFFWLLFFLPKKKQLVGSSGLEPLAVRNRRTSSHLRASSRSLAHWSSASLTPPQAALSFGLSRLSGVLSQECPVLKKDWWAQVDSNHRPHAYQACALTS